MKRSRGMNVSEEFWKMQFKLRSQKRYPKKMVDQDLMSEYRISGETTTIKTMLQISRFYLFERMSRVE